MLVVDGGAFMKNCNRGRAMELQVMDEGPFSDFGIEAEIIGFSLGTIVLVVLIGFLSLLLGRFVRVAILPALASHFLGEIEESEGVRGSRALSLGISLVLFVEMTRTVDDSVVEMVWDEAWFKACSPCSHRFTS